MAKVRVKFECVEVKDHPEFEHKEVNFMPVMDGSEENKSFSKFTPNGFLKLTISYETEASKAFEIGKEYFIDITPAQ